MNPISSEPELSQMLGVPILPPHQLAWCCLTWRPLRNCPPRWMRERAKACGCQALATYFTGRPQADGLRCPRTPVGAENPAASKGSPGQGGLRSWLQRLRGSWPLRRREGGGEGSSEKQSVLILHCLTVPQLQVYAWQHDTPHSSGAWGFSARVAGGAPGKLHSSGSLVFSGE